MFILYLDEFGHCGKWDPANPRFDHHPLFGLAGFAIDANSWRAFDRGFLRLKKQFYAREIGRALVTKGIRPERYEPKRLRSVRDRRFAFAVLKLIQSVNGTLFASGRRKPVGLTNHNTDALYTFTVQGILKQFESYLRGFSKSKGRGIVVLDERQAAQDELVLASAQSYLFSGHDVSSPFDRIVETPLLVPSHWYHGAQAADIVARIVGQLFRYRTGNEAAFAHTETYFGTLLDSLTHVRNRRRSVFVKS